MTRELTPDEQNRLRRHREHIASELPDLAESDRTRNTTMPHEAQASDLAVEVQELREGVPPGYPLPEDSPQFWGWLETLLSEEVTEHPIKGSSHLVYRSHPWRRQPCLKARKLTVRQLVGTVKANGWDETQAARNLDLPVEAIREAIAYAEENRELLDFEAAYERLILACGRKDRGTAALP